MIIMDFFAHPLHPRFVHFPIALLLVGSLITIISFWKKEDWIGKSAIGLIIIGWLSTIPSVMTGLLEQNKVIPIEITNKIVTQHISSAIGMWILFGLFVFLHFKWKKIRIVWQNVVLIITILAGSILLIVTAHLGGRLVFEFGTGVK
jgi:uncharacterized membrane protein